MAAREKNPVMTHSPTFDDIFAVMSAASAGDTGARVPIPDDPRLDDMATKLAIALNLLLDDLAFRSAEREHMLEILRESEARKSSIVESALDCIITIDSQGRILEFNRAAEATFGYPPAAILGKSMAELMIPPALRERHRNSFENYLTTGKSSILGKRIEMTALRADGSEFPVELTITRVTDSHPPIFTGFLRDLTGRKRAEESLRESERHAHSLLRLSKRLERAQTYSEALSAAVDEVKVVVGYQNAWIYLLAEATGQFRLVTTTGGKSQEIVDDFPALTINGDRFLEEIVEGRDVVLVEDARTDPRTNKEIVAQLGNRTIVNVPIRLMGRHLGTFGTGSFGHEGVRIPSTAQVEYLRALASHLAVTLDRLHLLNERKRVEEALRESEKRYRNMFESAAVSIWEEDFTEVQAALDELKTQGVTEFRSYFSEHPEFVLKAVGKVKILSVNEQSLKMFGAANKDELLNSLHRIFLPETLNVFAEELVTLAEGRQYFEGESIIQTLRGERLPILVSIHFPEIGRQLDHTLVSLMDITERVQAEEKVHRLNEELEGRVAQRTAQLDLAYRELETSRREIQSIFDSMTTLNAKIALDGRLLLVNKIAVQASGLSLDELMKTNFLEGRWWAFDPEVQNRVKNALAEARAGKPVSYDEKIFVFGQVLTINLSLTPMRGQDGQVEYVLAEGKDITKLKEFEEALQAKTVQLEAANKELDAFSHSVSHDLRAPLRTIDGFSQALLEDYGYELPAEGRGYLERIRKATGHMAALIEDLLDLSRMTRMAMNLVSVDMSRLARDTVAELQSTQPERRVKLTIAPNVKARGDAQLLRVVLENLLSNAWKYTSKREQAEIEFGSKWEGDETIYFIRDNGAGFDMAYASKLFGAFQRLHKVTDFPGTGVGLATVQRIIRRHGGRIWAEAGVDRGATFFFTLPGIEDSKRQTVPAGEDSISDRAEQII